VLSALFGAFIGVEYVVDYAKRSLRSAGEIFALRYRQYRVVDVAYWSMTARINRRTFSQSIIIFSREVYVWWLEREICVQTSALAIEPVRNILGTDKFTGIVAYSAVHPCGIDDFNPSSWLGVGVLRAVYRDGTWQDHLQLMQYG
jgi:hypothetical protein